MKCYVYNCFSNAVIIVSTTLKTGEYTESICCQKHADQFPSDWKRRVYIDPYKPKVFSDEQVAEIIRLFHQEKVK